jgi:hypothetical protein
MIDVTFYVDSDIKVLTRHVDGVNDRPSFDMVNIMADGQVVDIIFNDPLAFEKFKAAINGNA